MHASKTSLDGAHYWALEKDTLAAVGQMPTNTSSPQPPSSDKDSPKELHFPKFERAVRAQEKEVG
jgi:hypothetical protein